jgi:hypothetical protein
MDVLFKALAQARAGHGQVVAVVGEPGVGKSRLSWEVMPSLHAQGYLTLEAAAASYGNATIFAPVIALLRTYFQIESRDDPRKIREKVTGYGTMHLQDPTALPRFGSLRKNAHRNAGHARSLLEEDIVVGGDNLLDGERCEERMAHGIVTECLQQLGSCCA